jgi:hypothetical protein
MLCRAFTSAWISFTSASVNRSGRAVRNLMYTITSCSSMSDAVKYGSGATDFRFFIFRSTGGRPQRYWPGSKRLEAAIALVAASVNPTANLFG